MYMHAACLIFTVLVYKCHASSQPQFAFKQYSKLDYPGNNRVYIHVFEPTLTFSRALQACASHHMRLVEVKNNAELNFLEKLRMMSGLDKHAWVGGANFSQIFQVEPRTFTWVQSREPIPGKGAWFFDDDQPDDAEGWESCVALKYNKEKATVKGHDRNCEISLPFFCQTVSYDKDGNLWGKSKSQAGRTVKKLSGRSG